MYFRHYELSLNPKMLRYNITHPVLSVYVTPVDTVYFKAKIELMYQTGTEFVCAVYRYAWLYHINTLYLYTDMTFELKSEIGWIG